MLPILLVFFSVCTGGYNKNQIEDGSEVIKCFFDSKETKHTEMFGLGEEEVGERISNQATLIDLSSDRKHIHVVFLEATGSPSFAEKDVYSLRGEFKIYNPTEDGKLRKFPVANYEYFLVSSWRKEK